MDEHHLVEDTGIVFGEALNRLSEKRGSVRRYGNNSHHVAEAPFKAFGAALSRAYAPAPSAGMWTKGTLD